MTTKEDRKAPPGIDRERALAALIFCASKHPAESLGDVIDGAIHDHYKSAFAHPSSLSDPEFAVVLHAYAKQGR